MWRDHEVNLQENSFFSLWPQVSLISKSATLPGSRRAHKTEIQETLGLGRHFKVLVSEILPSGKRMGKETRPFLAQ